MQPTLLTSDRAFRIVTPPATADTLDEEYIAARDRFKMQRARVEAQLERARRLRDEKWGVE
jgi:hypothetical protein